MTKIVLVTGATGNVGRALVHALLARGVHVRALTRDPDAADLPAAVEVVRGHLEDESIMAPALDGVDAAFQFIGADRGHAFCAAAADVGVDRVTLLSSAAVGLDNEVSRRHVEAETALAAAGVPAVVLRPGEFMSNAASWAPAVKRTGAVRAPYPRFQSAPIHPGDIAAVAAAGLTGELAPGVYELSGPELLTAPAKVDIIAQVLGREVRYEEQSHDEARAEMLQFMPEGMVDAVLALWRDGGTSRVAVTPVFEEVTGRPAQRFADWVDQNRALFG